MKNHLLIIGGMGPQASVELHQLIVRKAEKRASAPDEFPNIVHLSLAVKDFISDDTTIDAAIDQINTATPINLTRDAAAIGIACNTAHLLLPHLSLAEQPSFTSMIEAVCAHARQLGVRRVGLLASPHTIHSGLYTKPLVDQSINVIEPTAAECKELESIIRGVIAGHDHAALRNRLTKLAAKQVKNGAELVILGCTELPIVGVDNRIPNINSLDCLADVMLGRFYREASV